MSKDVWVRKTSKPKKGSRPLPAPGFYVPMDIAPDEYGSTTDYDKLKAGIIRVLEADWGERCKTSDLEDFPELHDDLVVVGDPDMGRCPVCLVYEKFDKFWELLVPKP